MNLMVYAAYHSRLEISYIMDENGLPPPPPNPGETDTLCDDGDVSVGLETLEHPETSYDPKHESFVGKLVKNPDVLDALSTSKEGKSRTTSAGSHMSRSDDYTILHVTDVERSITRHRLASLELASMEDYLDESIEVPKPDDGAAGKAPVDDPLTVYQRTQDESVFSADEPLQVHVKNDAAQFKKHIDEVILTVSPYVQYEVPYLLTEPGVQSRLRSFFPEQIFWSAAFEETDLKRTMWMGEVTKDTKRRVSSVDFGQSAQNGRGQEKDKNNII